jgi:hypothetical protein
MFGWKISQQYTESCVSTSPIINSLVVCDVLLKIFFRLNVEKKDCYAVRYIIIMNNCISCSNLQHVAMEGIPHFASYVTYFPCYLHVRSSSFLHENVNLLAGRCIIIAVINGCVNELYSCTKSIPSNPFQDFEVWTELFFLLIRKIKINIKAA